MRFGHDKVHDLAQQILDLLGKDPGVSFLAPEDAVRVTIGSAILDDLEEEDAIEREVDDLLRQHAAAIDQEDMDVGSLRRRFKGEIARKRGFII